MESCLYLKVCALYDFQDSNSHIEATIVQPDGKGIPV